MKTPDSIAVARALPLERKIPNEETRRAMAEIDEIMKTRAERFATADDPLEELEDDHPQPEGDAGPSEEAIAMNDQLNREEREILEKFNQGELRSVIRGGVPEAKVPNAETRRAMAESEEMMRRGTARFTSAEEMFAELEKAGDQ